MAAEYLFEEDGLKIDHETLRRLLISNGLWSRQRKRSPYRRCRECKAQFGELIQMDGSIHDWLDEGRNSCLLNMVDDATGKTLAHLDTGETTRSVFIVLWEWIKRYGVPLALYVDLKNVYVSPKDLSFSHVQIACKKLGICIIKAYSPQAKGRVERNHAVYQDRFIKELRLRKAKTIDEANKILSGGFVDKLNKKFEKIPRDPNSAHIPLGKVDLNQILCWEHTRQIQHDWTFTFKGKYYQIKKQYGSNVRPKASVYVRKHLDGAISVWYQEEKLAFEIAPKRILAHTRVTGPKPNVINLEEMKEKKKKSPWRTTNSYLFK